MFSLSLSQAEQYCVTSESEKNIPALGEQDWSSKNNPNCPESQRISLSACRPSEFNCWDGNCVKMTQRCNQRSECQDGSDEFNCQTIPFLKEYQVSISTVLLKICGGKTNIMLLFVVLPVLTKLLLEIYLFALFPLNRYFKIIRSTHKLTKNLPATCRLVIDSHLSHQVVEDSLHCLSLCLFVL